jgi:predicted amidohydrolase YtcJ/heat shock protein HslJ
MRAMNVWSAIVTTMVMCAGTMSVRAEEPRAEVIFKGGRILTMQGATPQYVEALAVREGRIGFVGSEADAMKLRGPATTVRDLGGAALLPGFIDGHSHYASSLLVANQCKLYAPPSGPGKDVASIVAELQRFVADRKIPEGELVMGYGYDDTVMPEGRLLNRDDLDKAFPKHPVRVDHVSMHGGVMNSLALKKYGISSETKTPPGGVIVRKPGTQEPWGLIMESAFLPVFEQTEPMTTRQEVVWTRAGQMLYAQAGVTTAHEGATHLQQLEAIERASKAGANIIDVVAYPFITDLDPVLEKYPVSEWGTYRNRFKIGGVKITLDGSPQGRTAMFTTPYLTGGPAGETDWKGEPTFPHEYAMKGFKQVYDLNVPLIVHCNGDAAIDLFLEGYEHARGGAFDRPWNVTTIHTQFLRKDQIAKFVKYGVRPSFYTLHTFYFADAHVANRGAAQAAYISPMRDAIDAGLTPTNHTDFVVAPLDQMMMLWSAVNRISRSGEEVGADQRVTTYEGLQTMTVWASAQYGEQASKGTLEVGKLADMVILDKDPLSVKAMELRDIKVMETLKEGVTIFPAPAGRDEALAASVPERPGVYAWRAHLCDRTGVNAAAHRTWTLKTLGDEVIAVSTPPTMQFSHGRLSVFGGVNRLSGAYAFVQDRVVMGELVATKMAGEATLMELDKRFAETLAAVDSFTVKGDTLALSSKGKVVATFVALVGGDEVK